MKERRSLKGVSRKRREDSGRGNKEICKFFNLGMIFITHTYRGDRRKGD